MRLKNVSSVHHSTTDWKTNFMKAFLVHVSGVKEVIHSEESKNELYQRLNELLRENILQRSFLSEDQNEMWLHILADDLEILEMIVKSINPILA